jgi:hypothetical protein
VNKLPPAVESHFIALPSSRGGVMAAAPLSVTAMPFIVKLRRAAGGEAPHSLRTMTMRARVHDLKTEAAAHVHGWAAVTCRIDPNSELLRGV